MQRKGQGYPIAYDSCSLRTTVWKLCEIQIASLTLRYVFIGMSLGGCVKESAIMFACPVSIAPPSSKEPSLIVKALIWNTTCREHGISLLKTSF